MGFGTSVALIAIGAILKWAVMTSVSGISLGTVGVILMICGVLLLVLTLIFWSPWAFGRRDVGARDRYYDPRSPREPLP
jgi:TRAP-type C4-dicarboxylate transport system permease small subunit